MALQIINVSCMYIRASNLFLSASLCINYSQLFQSSDVTLEQKSKAFQ